jgi:hypothetical protein
VEVRLAGMGADDTADSSETLRGMGNTSITSDYDQKFDQDGEQCSGVSSTSEPGPPNPNEEKKEYQRISERQEILNRLDRHIAIELEGHKWEITAYNPLKFVIAHENLKRVVHAYIKSSRVEDPKTEEVRTVNRLCMDKIIINAIPIEVILEQNPLGFDANANDGCYTITYNTFANKKFTIKSRSLDDHIADLKQRALLCESRGAVDALSIVVGAYNRLNLAVVNHDI